MNPRCSLCLELLFKPQGYEVWLVTIERAQVRSTTEGGIKAEPNMPPVTLNMCDNCAARHRSSIAVLKTKGT